MTRAADTRALIGRLAAESAPVRRLWAPGVRAALFLFGAAIVLAAVVAYSGFDPNLSTEMARPGAMMSWLAAIATGIAAVFAAFLVALPDRSPRWAWLPIAPLAVWISGLGMGCYADWIRTGPDGIRFGDSTDCFKWVIILSFLVGVPMIVLLRHALLVRPVLTAALGGLAVAALSSAALQLFHRDGAGFMDIVWHTAAVVLIVAIGSAAGVVSRPEAKRR